MEREGVVGDIFLRAQLKDMEHGKERPRGDSLGGAGIGMRMSLGFIRYEE